MRNPFRRFRFRTTALALVFVLVVALMALGGKQASAQSATPGYRVLGWNNLGMHCDDADFAVFSILPPFNVLVAQVVGPTGVLITDPTGLKVTYQAVADPTGSINTSSAGKGNFWDHIFELFGVSLPVDSGLAGSNMPGAGNTPQPMIFDPAFHWFIANGIPIVPYDDAKVKNFYPLMRVSVRNSTGTVLASSDVVLPISDEMDCSACHTSGSAPAARPAAGWVFDADSQRDFRLNVLRLHDDRQLSDPAYTAALAKLGYNAGGLYPTVTLNKTAVLCSHCHASEALPGTGISGIPPLTSSIHTLHGKVIDPTNGLTLESSTNRSACYRCHPGATTRCLRGVMGNSVAVDGTMNMQCQNCHGPMSAVGASTRTGWLMEPNCQSCHTGTAVTNAGAIRFTSVFASPGVVRSPANPTFATNPNTPAAGFSLYRFSSGHGGVQCEGCHGSTHAEYASSHPNDNIGVVALQGHVGTVGECATCHNPVPSTTNGGPHGMHPVGQAWVSQHHEGLSGGTSQCQNCHGADFRGTVLSRSFADRTISAFGTKTFWRGFQIGCYTCHNGPSSDSGNSNSPAVVSDLTASTSAGVAVAIHLLASDPNGNAMTLRIVSQPANGTVGLSGTTATYFPPPGFSGVDRFTYAAWDGSTDSNLGHVTVTVGSGACSLSCSAAAPAVANQGTAVQFTGTATPSNCSGTVTYQWNFGDGSAISTFQSPTHTYASTGSFTWRLTSSVAGVTCTQTGTITITAPSTCTLACSASVPASAVQGTAVALAGSATPSSCAGAVSYMWNFGDNSAPATVQNPTHTYVSTGTFSWTLTASIAGATCTRSGTITITTSTGCVLSCSATVPVSARTDRQVTFSASATLTNCSGDLRYRWTFGDGTTSNSRITTHSYRRSGTYRWSVVVTSGTATCTRTGSITIGGGSSD